MRLKDVKRLNKCEFGSEMFFRILPFKITNFAIVSITYVNFLEKMGQYQKSSLFDVDNLKKGNFFSSYRYVLGLVCTHYASPTPRSLYCNFINLISKWA